MSNVVEIVLEGVDNASDVIGGVTKTLGGFGDFVGGALTKSLAVAAGAIGGMTVALGASVMEASQAQEAMAQLDAVLKSTGEAAMAESQAWEDAQGKVVTTAGLSADALSQLKDKYRGVEIAIAEQVSKLQAIEQEHGTANTVYEKEAIKLRELQGKLAKLNAEMENGQPKTMSMVNALGLLPPVARMTRDELVNLANELQGVTRFSDEAIIGGESLLLTFTNIGKDVFPDVTKIMLDMSTAMKQDLKSSAIQLGKALNNPLEGLTALTRVGVMFTKQQEKQIKALMNMGDVAGAQRIILAELEKEFGGSAEAAGQTFAGQLDILKNKFSDIQEAIGGALLPVLQDVLAGVGPILDEIGKNVTTFLPVIKLSFSNLAPHVEEFITTLGGLLGLDFSSFNLDDMVSDLVVSFGLILNKVGLFLDFLSATLPDVLNTAKEKFQPLIDAVGNLKDAWDSQLPAMQASGATFMDWLRGAFGAIGPQLLENLTGAVNALAEIWRKHGDEIMEVVRLAFEIIVATIGGAFVLISGIVTAALQLLSGNWQGALDAMSGSWTAFLEMVLSIAGTNLETFSATWESNWEMLQLIVSTVLMNITAGFQDFLIKTINKVKEFLPQFLALGQEMVNNILIGIQMKVSQVIGAVEGLVRSALDAAGLVLGGGSVGGMGGRGVGRALGGPVSSGGAYIVGERGPELFIPNTSGQIIPNGGAPTAAGGSPIQVTVTLDSGVLFSAMSNEAGARGYEFAMAA